MLLPCIDDTSTTIPSNNLHLEFNVINVIIEELCDEAKDESWKAIGAIYLHTPFTDKLNAKNVPIDTMLSIGCHDSILSKLLEAGADANGYTAGHSPKGTRSPLDIAFEKSRYRAAALLIKYGAKIYKYVSTKRDEPKLHTILRIAIERGE